MKTKFLKSLSTSSTFISAHTLKEGKMDQVLVGCHLEAIKDRLKPFTLAYSVK